MIGIKKDESGNALTITALLLPVVIMLLVLVADLGVIHLARSQVQMAADAGSLAAVAVEDEEILLAGYQLNSGPSFEFKVELNEQKARARAREVLIDNLKRVENIEWNENDFIFKKINNETYYVEITFEVNSVLLGTLFSTVKNDRLLLTVGSEGEVDLAP